MFDTPVRFASTIASPECRSDLEFAMRGAGCEGFSALTERPAPTTLCPGLRAIPPLSGGTAAGLGRTTMNSPAREAFSPAVSVRNGRVLEPSPGPFADAWTNHFFAAAARG